MPFITKDLVINAALRYVAPLVTRKFRCVALLFHKIKQRLPLLLRLKQSSDFTILMFDSAGKLGFDPDICNLLKFAWNVPDISRNMSKS